MKTVLCLALPEVGPVLEVVDDEGSISGISVGSQNFGQAPRVDLDRVIQVCGLATKLEQPHVRLAFQEDRVLKVFRVSFFVCVPSKSRNGPFTMCALTLLVKLWYDHSDVSLGGDIMMHR